MQQATAQASPCHVLHQLQEQLHVSLVLFGPQPSIQEAAHVKHEVIHVPLPTPQVTPPALQWGHLQSHSLQPAGRQWLLGLPCTTWPV